MPMSKSWNPRKKTVELHAPARPSRIRRDPVKAQQLEEAGKLQWWQSQEWEIPLAVIGIILFALAINAIAFGIGQVTN
jgi:hypothetical protein